MKFRDDRLNRRLFVGTAATALFTSRGLFADLLTSTPRLTEGPYYPDKLPLDTDNDLVIVSDSVTPAVGEITRLSGRVLDASGSPVRDALIEIWQVDQHGVYINSRAPNQAGRDKNFQGYGRFQTASTGLYQFRTIKPVPYDNRCPHIHVRVLRQNREVLTTQIFVNGHSMNKRDGVLSELRDPIDRELVMADFRPSLNSATNELTAKFDIVLGRTPEIGRRSESR